MDQQPVQRYAYLLSTSIGAFTCFAIDLLLILESNVKSTNNLVKSY